MKTQSKTREQPIAEAISEAARSSIIGKSTEDMAKGKKTGKIAVTRAPTDHSAEGERDAKLMLAAERTIGEERIKIYLRFARFAHLGYAPSTGKKLVFHAEIETYFNGWKKVRDALPASEKGAFGPRYSEGRRVMNAFLHYCAMSPGKNEDGVLKGVAHVTAILSAETGTYHEKLGSLPKADGSMPTPRAPRQTTPPTGGGVPVLAEVEKQSDAEQRSRFAAYTAKEIGNMVAGLPEQQMPVLLHAITLRLKASADKGYQAVGQSIGKWLAKADAEAASDSPDRAAQAAVG